MKKRILTMSLCLFSIGLLKSQAQSPNTAWRTASSSDNNIIKSNDGNIINYSTQNGNIIIEKINPLNGSVEWTSAEFGGNGENVCNQIINSTDGGYIFVGRSSSSNIPLNSHKGGNDGWIVKLNSNGILEWQKTIGGTGNDNLRFIQQNPDNSYIISGATNSTNGDLSSIPSKGGNDRWVIKLNEDGSINWHKTYGGSSSDIVSIMLLNASNNIILSGNSTSTNGDLTSIPHKGANDVWIMEVSHTNGDILWSKRYGGSKADVFASVTEDNVHGGYICAGYTLSDDLDILFGGSTKKDGQDYWVVKLDINGDMQWQKCYGGTGNDQGAFEQAYSVNLTQEGHYIVGGIAVSADEDVSMPKGGNSSDIWILWLDENGNIIRDKSYGGTMLERFTSIIQSSNGSFIISGKTASIDGDVIDGDPNGGSAAHPNIPERPWVLQIDREGKIEWSKYIFETGDNLNISLTSESVQTSDGGIVLASNTWIVKLRPCPENISLTEKICAGTTYDFNGRILSIAGEYKDTLTTVGGCDSIITLTLEVAPLPTPAITAVQKELSTTSFESYQWLLNNQPLASANSQTYTPDQSGTYRVITTNENNCSDTSAAFEFNIAGDPFLLRDKYTWKFSIPGMGEQVSDHIFYEDSILYQMAGTAYTTDYKMNKEYFDATEQRWIGVGEGGSIDKTGIYFVMFFKEDRGDSILIYKHECADQAEAYAFPFPAPDATTDHGWNWYVKAGTATSIAAAQELNATIYPNPVADELNISLSNNNAVEISITTLDGREVLSDSFAGRTTIQAGTLPQGIYVVRISENGVLKTVQKIVKQ
jgi:hypothetical protein